MKRNCIIILTLLMVVIGSSAAIGQETLSINSEKLNKQQKETLEYALNMLKNKNNQISLPLELNSFIGDTLSHTSYIAKPQIKDAYFLLSKDDTDALMIPLTSKTESGEIESILCVMNDGKERYYRMISTMFDVQEKGDKTSAVIRSNVDGIFLNAYFLKNDKVMEQIDGVVGMYGVYEGGDDTEGKNKHISNSRIERRFTNINVLKSKNRVGVYSQLARRVKIAPGSLTPAPERNDRK